eukprot:m.793131 g.793131  ORF g.793131 m.793131 type:complete len:512 (-) comp23334_c0_seq1:1233-2768(-)
MVCGTRPPMPRVLLTPTPTMRLSFSRRTRSSSVSAASGAGFSASQILLLLDRSSTTAGAVLVSARGAARVGLGGSSSSVVELPGSTIVPGSTLGPGSTVVLGATAVGAGVLSKIALRSFLIFRKCPIDLTPSSARAALMSALAARRAPVISLSRTAVSYCAKCSGNARCSHATTSSTVDVLESTAGAAAPAVLSRTSTVEEVVAWLQRALPEHFAQYDTAVRDNEITGARLAASADIKAARALLGVKSIGHFLKIKKDLKAILDSTPAPTAVAPSTTVEPGPSVDPGTIVDPGSSTTDEEDPPRPTRAAPRAETSTAPAVVEDRSNKSKIWLALNPAPLAAETEEERMRRENDKRIVGVGVNSTRGIGGLVPQTMEDLDVDGLLGPRNQTESDDLNLTSSDEDDEEDDDFDPNRLELDDLGLGQLEQRRRERDEAEKVRQAELRAKHLVRQQQINASREELQLKINRQKEEDQRKRDAEIDQVVESAHKRLSQLRFSFSFSKEKKGAESET